MAGSFRVGSRGTSIAIGAIDGGRVDTGVVCHAALGWLGITAGATTGPGGGVAPKTKARSNGCVLSIRRSSCARSGSSRSSPSASSGDVVGACGMKASCPGIAAASTSRKEAVGSGSSFRAVSAEEAAAAERCLVMTSVPPSAMRSSSPSSGNSPLESSARRSDDSKDDWDSDTGLRTFLPRERGPADCDPESAWRKPPGRGRRVARRRWRRSSGKA